MNRLILSLIIAAMGIIPSAAAKVAQVTINGSPVKKTVTAVSFNGDKVTIHFDDDNTTDADMGDVLLSLPTEIPLRQ